MDNGWLDAALVWRNVVVVVVVFCLVFCLIGSILHRVLEWDVVGG
jgi:hypothetical protein